MSETKIEITLQNDQALITCSPSRHELTPSQLESLIQALNITLYELLEKKLGKK